MRAAQEFAQLADMYGSKLAIVAFPCNQFGQQEPGSAAEIKAFAREHRFTGLLMDKVDVNGPNASPVFTLLKSLSGDSTDIRWNFGGKFLVSKRGDRVLRCARTERSSVACRGAATRCTGWCALCGAVQHRVLVRSALIAGQQRQELFVRCCCISSCSQGELVPTSASAPRLAS